MGPMVLTILLPLALKSDHDYTAVTLCDRLGNYPLDDAPLDEAALDEVPYPK